MGEQITKEHWNAVKAL